MTIPSFTRTRGRIQGGLRGGGGDGGTYTRSLKLVDFGYIIINCGTNYYLTNILKNGHNLKKIRNATLCCDIQQQQNIFSFIFFLQIQIEKIKIYISIFYKMIQKKYISTRFISVYIYKCDPGFAQVPRPFRGSAPEPPCIHKKHFCWFMGLKLCNNLIIICQTIFRAIYQPQLLQNQSRFVKKIVCLTL
eukprot:TRINITY_DN4363_c1_g1_i3.p1 TRINITY_DN4363_c1_g1~~TRINITY_DN4363_c1_g1_i3.p1  ORF type:complete len:197 (-),score=-5.52 TRINITY_DN4363_c1_g1_i3:21-590(-)